MLGLLAFGVVEQRQKDISADEAATTGLGGLCASFVLAQKDSTPT